jgi:hypothetical protein
MAKNNKDGGPAFPVPVDAINNQDGSLLVPSQYGLGPQPGMTLRDWFAGQIASGFAALPDERSHRSSDGDAAEWRRRLMLQDAEYCYAMADAMLKARQQ